MDPTRFNLLEWITIESFDRVYRNTINTAYLFRFLKWLYYLNIEPDTRLKPEIVNNFRGYDH